MKLPHARRALVPDRKLERYLLDVDHPEGGPKARFFLRCGFAADRPEGLRSALLEVAAEGRVAETESVPHGTKYVVDGEARTPEEVTIRLRTVWIILSDETRPRFVTAYPAPGRA